MSVKLSKEDYVGKQFGRLTVLDVELRQTNNHRFSWFQCRCECGNEIWRKADHVKRGETQSCGCLQRDRVVETCKTHGMSETRLFHIWECMLQRCEKTYTSSFPIYGGRGITVCDEWQTFEPFMEWALSHGYSDSLTIDRVDGDGNYEPLNCRWATETVQNRNKGLQRNNTSGHKGVYWDKESGKWKAQINGNYERVNLGRFKNIEDAIAARKAGEAKYWGNER